MGFRDDREALRAHKEQLHTELEETKAKLEAHEQKDVRDEAELKRLRKEVERLRRATGQSRPDARSGPNRAPMVAASAVLMVAGAAMAGFISMRGGDSEPVPAEVAVPSVPGTPGVVTAPALPAMPQPSPGVPVRFAATITSSTGRPDLPIGAGCVVEAEVAASDVGALRVRCLEQLVYDPLQDVGMSMTMRSSGARPRSTAVGDVYLVEYSDTGQRSGPRAQIAFDAQRSTLRVWSEGGTPFDLRFAVDERGLRDALEGAPRTQAPEARWRVAATLRGHEGELPFTARECELSVLPEVLGGPGFSCRAQLRCGDVLVYGANTSGYNRCETVVRGAQAFPSAHDRGVSAEDSDPSFELDLAERTLRVADAIGGRAWEARFALAESPRCTLDDTWVGVLDGVPVRLRPEGRGLRFEGAIEGPVAAELRCLHGEAALVLEGPALDGVDDAARRIQGRFGPGFATFVALTSDGRPLSLMRLLP